MVFHNSASNLLVVIFGKIVIFCKNYSFGTDMILYKHTLNELILIIYLIYDIDYNNTISSCIPMSQ